MKKDENRFIGAVQQAAEMIDASYDEQTDSLLMVGRSVLDSRTAKVAMVVQGKERNIVLSLVRLMAEDGQLRQMVETAVRMLAQKDSAAAGREDGYLSDWPSEEDF